MAWFRVDDSFYDHEKVEDLWDNHEKHAAGALALWLRAGSWSSKHLTDGHVPPGKLRRLDASKAHAKALVAVGLWELDVVDDPDGGWTFHDWADWNPTRAEVQGRRDADAERKRTARGIRAESRRTSERTPSGVTAGVRSTRPDPSLPGPDPDQSLPGPAAVPRAHDSGRAEPGTTGIEPEPFSADGPSGQWRAVVVECGMITPPGGRAMKPGRKSPPGLMDRLEESSVVEVVAQCHAFSDLCRADPGQLLVPGDKREGGSTVIEQWGAGRLFGDKVWEAVGALLARRNLETAAAEPAPVSDTTTSLLGAARRAGGARV